MRVKPDLTFDKFVSEVKAYHSKLKAEDWTIRYGQTLFQCVWDVRPDIADELRGHRLDPFHKEQVSVETYEFIKDRW